MTPAELLTDPDLLAQLVDQQSRAEHDAMRRCMVHDHRQGLGGHLQAHLHRLACARVATITRCGTAAECEA